MSNQLTDEELAALMPSELCAYQTPIPTQIVASDEFYPDPQNERQREVESAAAGDGRRSRGQAGHGPPQILPDRRRHGRVLRGDERGLRAAVRREQGGSRHARDGAGARQRAERPVHHGHAHAFPARRHPHHDLRQHAHRGGQGRLEQGARQPRADHRGPEIQQLQKRDVSGQRHQDLADLLGAVRHRAGLVPDQRADGGRAQEASTTRPARAGCSAT